MYQHTYSSVILGLSAIPVEIECSTGNGLPSFRIVGIPASYEQAARERVRSALRQVKIPLPSSRLTINVRPVDPRQKLSAGAALDVLDLPIALLVAACQQHIPSTLLDRCLWFGQLSLSGAIKPLFGALPLALSALNFPFQIEALFFPKENVQEAELSKAYPVTGLSSLSEAMDTLIQCHHMGPDYMKRRLHPEKGPVPTEADPSSQEAAQKDKASAAEDEGASSFDALIGQEGAKRAAVIAASGMHNLLLIGPPGCGKTTLARALPSLLPPLSHEEKLELTRIYSCMDMMPEGQSMITQRPFRSPHHSITLQALLGGGAAPVPGEITLAHHGTLLLDEFSEFSRAALEALREPLEEHQIHISRIQSSIVYPADFLLAAGMNPCPCGYYPDRTRCHCTPSAIERYYHKINTPLLDRIDLVFRMDPVKAGSFDVPSLLTFSKAKEMVLRAKKRQEDRFDSESMVNSRMSAAQIKEYCHLDSALSKQLSRAIDRFSLSVRAYQKVLKTARTIADMEASPTIEEPHLMEALQYRELTLFSAQ